jgi:hypothetical protein
MAWCLTTHRDNFTSCLTLILVIKMLELLMILVLEGPRCVTVGMRRLSNDWKTNGEIKCFVKVGCL